MTTSVLVKDRQRTGMIPAAAMWRSLVAVTLLAACALTPPAHAQDVAANSNPTKDVQGVWITEKHDGAFRIAPCGDAICGTLVGLDYKDNEPVPTGKDGKSECNLVMLTGFRPQEEKSERLGGKILDPDTGNVYQAQIWSPEPGVLKLRGYVMIPLLGETRTWTRYTGKIGPGCRLPQN
ncbi:DUF2147 domain-containing protein [Acetobacter estunensis]|nr:DUF2147 domain-containing protein [Acetobacter estunensis]